MTSSLLIIPMKASCVAAVVGSWSSKVGVDDRGLLSVTPATVAHV